MIGRAGAVVRILLGALALAMQPGSAGQAAAQAVEAPPILDPVPHAAGGEEGLPDGPEAVADRDGFDPARLALWPMLRVGLVLDPATSGFATLEPFRERLEAGLGLPVAILAYPSLSRLQAGLIRGEVDYAPVSATAFAEAAIRCRCLVPLAVGLSQDGSSGWMLTAITRPDEVPARIEDLAGLRLALLPPPSLAGRRLPLALLERAGVPPAPDMVASAADPLAALDAVARGRADVAFGWQRAAQAESPRVEALASLDARAPRGGTLAVLAASFPPASDLVETPLFGPVPNPPHVIHVAVPETIRDDVRRLVMELAAGPLPAGLAPHGLAPVEAGAFDALIGLLEAGGSPSAGRLRPLGGGRD